MNKSNCRLVSNQTGFTLIEILIAIFLLAFVSLGIVSITSDSQLTKERTINKDRDNLQIETALSRFEWDFSQIYSPLYYSQRLQLAGDPNGQQQVTPEQQQLFEAVNNRYIQMETFAFSNKDGVPVPRFYSPDKSTFEKFIPVKFAPVKSVYLRLIYKADETPGKKIPRIKLKSGFKYSPMFGKAKLVTHKELE
jgi:prepilin-type N-terminal cleavage/methylation domain-containing protein